MSIQFDPEHEREQWLESRKLGIGGSDAPVILGYSPYQGPLGLYYERLGMTLETDEAPQEAAYWGKRLEDLLADEFAIRSGKHVVTAQFQMTHPERTWQRGTIDRMVYDSYLDVQKKQPAGVLEIKTTGVRREQDWKDGPPLGPWTQLQHYLAVTELPRGWICVLIGGQNFRYYDVERDNDFIDNTLIPAEADFWRRLQEQDPPPVDDLASTNQIIDARFPVGIAEQSVALDEYDDATSVIDTMLRAKWQSKEVSKVITQCESYLKEKMGTAEYATLQDEIVATWKTHTTSRVDLKMLRASYPDMVDDLTRESQVRRFVVRGSRSNTENEDE
jgi:putative phage-type endonuclease